MSSISTAEAWIIDTHRSSPNAENGQDRSRYYFIRNADSAPDTATLQEWVKRERDSARGVKADRQAATLLDLGVAA